MPNRGARAVEVDEQELDRLLRSPAGPVAAWLSRVTEKAAQRVKAKAPVGQPSRTPAGHPAGFLRSRTEWSLSRDSKGLWSEIGNDAVTSSANPFPGEPYPFQIEDPKQRKRKAPPFARDVKPWAVQAVMDVLQEETG